MTSINKIGFMVASITVIILAILYGSWQGFVWFKDLHQKNTKQAVATSPSATPVATLSPEQIQQLKVTAVQALGNNGTYTSQYLATLPVNLAQTDVLDQTRVEAFVNQNKGQLLPTIQPEQIKTTSATGKEAIKAYLDSISSATNPAIKSVSSDDIQTAYQAFYADPQQSKALKDVEGNLQGNADALKAVATPTEAMFIQTKLIAASQSLLTNVTLLETMPKDLIGGLIAAKNIQDLGPIFADIQTAIDALQKKYSL